MTFFVPLVFSQVLTKLINCGNTIAALSGYDVDVYVADPTKASATGYNVLANVAQFVFV